MLILIGDDCFYNLRAQETNLHSQAELIFPRQDVIEYPVA
jgi:hypothetical protein